MVGPGAPVAALAATERPARVGAGAARFIGWSLVEERPLRVATADVSELRLSEDPPTIGVVDTDAAPGVLMGTVELRGRAEASAAITVRDAHREIHTTMLTTPGVLVASRTPMIDLAARAPILRASIGAVGSAEPLRAHRALPGVTACRRGVTL